MSTPFEKIFLFFLNVCEHAQCARAINGSKRVYENGPGAIPVKFFTNRAMKKGRATVQQAPKR